MQTRLSLDDEHAAVPAPAAVSIERKQAAAFLKPDYVGFERHAERLGKEVLELKNPLVVHHFDCDGLTSGALTSAAFLRSGVQPHRVCLKRLDEEKLGDALRKAEAVKSRELVFTDIGSGFLDRLEKLAGHRIFVLDHHPPLARFDELPEHIRQVNVHDFGIDGAIELCSASTAYYCFKHVRARENEPGFGKPLEQIGAVGAVGDVQDQGGLRTLNRKMVEDGVGAGSIRVRTDLRVFGRVSKPLVWFLTYLTEPFFPGLSSNEKACALFLDALGIPLKNGDTWMHYNDLAPEQKQELASALIEYGLSKGVDPDALRGMVGEVYEFPREDPHTEPFDAYEFSTLLNACGRHKNPETGVRVCLAEPEALPQAKALLAEHRKQIQGGILYAKNHFVDVGAFYYVDARGHVSDAVIGTVAGGFLGSGLAPRTKPIIALSLDEDNPAIVKASSRATSALVDAGLHLGKAMRASAEGIGGIGGGHSVAAGATFPQGAEMQFLQTLKRVIEHQMIAKA